MGRPARHGDYPKVVKGRARASTLALGLEHTHTNSRIAARVSVCSRRRHEELKTLFSTGASHRPASALCVCPHAPQENASLFDFELSEEDMSSLATLERGRRFNDPGVFCEGMGVFCPIFD